MANYTNLNDLFTAMANAIREKKNSTETIVADTFPEEIESLRTGFDYNNQDVTTIPDYAFYNCEDLNNVNCESLVSVGEGAFENCKNLENIVLYDGVESVGENAFKGCDNAIIYCRPTNIPDTWSDEFNPDNRPVVCGELFATENISATSDDNVVVDLYNVNLDFSNPSNGTMVIHGSGNIKNFTMYNSLYIMHNSFISNLIITHGITSIGDYCFAEHSFATPVIIPDSVTSIGKGAFDNGKLLSIIIPNSVSNIGESAFKNCIGLTSITIPNSVTSIGDNAFDGCADLININMSNSITSIGIDAFYDCERLTSITIPDSVTSIGNYAFYYCTSLTSITYTGTIAQWNAISFGDKWDDSTPDYTIHCTDGDIAKDGTITYHTTT